MKQLSGSKKKKLLNSLKNYRKKYLIGKYSEIDESATRLMINSFLNEVLGFISLDEIKTEYMIKGTYADYIVQMKKNRYFIVEVKAMSVPLSEKHLRQVVNYAANEGIDWALLTNGRVFQFYRILFEKPIDSKLVFDFDLADDRQLRKAADNLQFFTRSLISARELNALWSKQFALDPMNLSKLMYSKQVIGYLKRELKRVYKNKFDENEICMAVKRIIQEPVAFSDDVKVKRKRKSRISKNSSTHAEPAIAGPNPV